MTDKLTEKGFGDSLKTSLKANAGKIKDAAIAAGNYATYGMVGKGAASRAKGRLSARLVADDYMNEWQKYLATQRKGGRNIEGNANDLRDFIKRYLGGDQVLQGIDPTIAEIAGERSNVDNATALSRIPSGTSTNTPNRKNNQTTNGYDIPNEPPRGRGNFGRRPAETNPALTAPTTSQPAPQARRDDLINKITTALSQSGVGTEKRQKVVDYINSLKNNPAVVAKYPELQTMSAPGGQQTPTGHDIPNEPPRGRGNFGRQGEVQQPSVAPTRPQPVPSTVSGYNVPTEASRGRGNFGRRPADIAARHPVFGRGNRTESAKIKGKLVEAELMKSQLDKIFLRLAANEIDAGRARTELPEPFDSNGAVRRGRDVGNHEYTNNVYDPDMGGMPLSKRHGRSPKNAVNASKFLKTVINKQCLDKALAMPQLNINPRDVEDIAEYLDHHEGSVKMKTLIDSLPNINGATFAALLYVVQFCGS